MTQVVAWRIGAASNVRGRRCNLAEERSNSGRHKGKSQAFILRRQMAGDHSSTTLTLTDMSSLCSSRASVFLVCFSNGMFRSSNSDQIDSLSSPAIKKGRSNLELVSTTRGWRVEQFANLRSLDPCPDEPCQLTAVILPHHDFRALPCRNCAKLHGRKVDKACHGVSFIVLVLSRVSQLLYQLDWGLKQQVARRQNLWREKGDMLLVLCKYPFVKSAEAALLLDMNVENNNSAEPRGAGQHYRGTWVPATPSLFDTAGTLWTPPQPGQLDDRNQSENQANTDEPLKLAWAHLGHTALPRVQTTSVGPRTSWQWSTGSARRSSAPVYVFKWFKCSNRTGAGERWGSW